MASPRQERNGEFQNKSRIRHSVKNQTVLLVLNKTSILYQDYSSDLLQQVQAEYKKVLKRQI